MGPPIQLQPGKRPARTGTSSERLETCQGLYKGQELAAKEWMALWSLALQEARQALVTPTTTTS